MESQREYTSRKNFNFLFSFVSWLSFIVCMIPLLFPNLFGSLQAPDDSSITDALLSNENKLALVVSLCLTGPLFIDLFIRAIISVWSHASKKSVGPPVILLMSLVLPDLALLFPVVARLGYDFYNFIINVRFIFAVWSALSFMNSLSNNMWNKKSALALYIAVNATVVINNYYVFVKIKILAFLMALMIGILSLIIFYFLFRISFRWYTYVYHSTKIKVLSTEQYLGTIYMTSVLFLFLWSICSFFYSMSGTKWYDVTTEMVILQDMKYTIFYVMLIVFENRAVQRDMTMTKVRNE